MRYWITSKVLKGKILYRGSTDNIENSRKAHIDYLRHNFHPDPLVLDHVQRYGLKDIEFKTDEKPIEAGDKKRKRVGKTEGIHRGG